MLKEYHGSDAGRAQKRDASPSTTVTRPSLRLPGPNGVRGFDVHAGVVVSASDREGPERLLRYCARPPLSLERLTVLGDGRIAYAIRKPWGNETHRVMSPLQFLARLAALIPPPRHPLIRFYGVFAPHSSWRAKVVPIRSFCCHQQSENGQLAAPLVFVRRGQRLEYPLWSLVAHVFNHQTHHRGQITTLFTQQGHDPGVTDLFAMLRDEAAPH